MDAPGAKPGKPKPREAELVLPVGSGGLREAVSLESPLPRPHFILSPFPALVAPTFMSVLAA